MDCQQEGAGTNAWTVGFFCFQNRTELSCILQRCSTGLEVHRQKTQSILTDSCREQFVLV
jgi:hypothetical protein